MCEVFDFLGNWNRFLISMTELAASIEANCIGFPLPCKDGNMLISSAYMRNLETIKIWDVRRNVLFLRVTKAKFSIRILTKSEYYRIAPKYKIFLHLCEN